MRTKEIFDHTAASISLCVVNKDNISYQKTFYYDVPVVCAINFLFLKII